VALRKLGINIVLVPNKGLADGIEAARNIIGRCYFDAARCAQGIKALKNYRKEFDERLNVFKTQPLHDWSSHAADAFRYFALSWMHIQTNARQQQPLSNTIDWENYA
jgi:hypothetical protein